MNAEQVAVLLAEGFEEIEAIAVIDVLRRAHISVTVVGVTQEPTVPGAHGIAVAVDQSIDTLAAEQCAMVVLPGGMPGAENLAASDAVKSLLRKVWQQGGQVAAICAAPIALHAAGLIEGVRVTAYPSCKDQLCGAVYTGARTEHDARITTGIGPGAAIEFALRLLEQLGMADTARELAASMIVA